MPRGPVTFPILMRTIQFANNSLRLIDQTRLPAEVSIVECRTVDEVASAIRTMQVRGAPAIGVAAAYGVALAAIAYGGGDADELAAAIDEAAEMLKSTRPTAVNLAWAVEQVRGLARATLSGRGTGAVEATKRAVLDLAERMADEDVAMNRTMGAFGAELIPPRATILTHCNAGSLACVDYGTALGVVRAAAEAGKRVHVYVDETRPFLQGARLTAWELQQAGIPMTLITDSMAGHFISRGQIDLVIVGADRIAANGDVANKIGTYTLAVLCKENDIPFYVAAPTSTFDLSLPSGASIPIEERSPDEVLRLQGQRIAPEGVQAAHPAFDVTPARYVTAIITERGICRAPYPKSLVAAAPAAELAASQ